MCVLFGSVPCKFFRRRPHRRGIGFTCRCRLPCGRQFVAVCFPRLERFGPFLVESDGEGNSLFERNSRQINEGLDELYQGLERPALGRFGETDRRSDELI